jgi:hypothetical protein
MVQNTFGKTGLAGYSKSEYPVLPGNTESPTGLKRVQEKPYLKQISNSKLMDVYSEYLRRLVFIRVSAVRI